MPSSLSLSFSLTVCPSLCQGPANLILIGYSWSWDPSTSLVCLSVHSVTSSCITCPCCSSAVSQLPFVIVNLTPLFVSSSARPLALSYLWFPSHFYSCAAAMPTFFSPSCCSPTSARACFYPISAPALFLVALTFQQTQQMALMLSATKQIGVTAVIRSQWHERGM